MKLHFKQLPFVLIPLLLLVFSSCRDNSVQPIYSGSQTSVHHSLAKVTFTEDFESGKKNSYSAGDVNFTSGTWTLTDALVGKSNKDVKNGSQSIRIQNSGSAAMKFDCTNGANTVTILHAKYGSDGNSTWGLWYSTDGGSSWTQTGNDITTSSTSLQLATFTVNVAGNVRFEIRKTDGSSNRINFDDFTVNDNVVVTTNFLEDFEAGYKSSYAVGDVNFASGTWTLNDALTGTLSSDVKNGSQSIRVRNSGTVTMKFDYTNGAGTVTVQHAKFGSDGNSTWGLWYSIDGGSTWTQTGSTVTTSSTSLQTATFDVNVAGNVRFEIRKTDGSSNRVNFDDFTINDYVVLSNFLEDFESGYKSAYAAADVNFTSGSWNLNDALTGTLSGDVKNGSQSIRVRNSGTVTMNFDEITNSSTVTIQHAKYGSDGNSTWELWYSTDNGTTWSQTGSTVTTSTTTFQTASFNIPYDGSIRIQIRKTDGSSNRINFDDFTISNTSGSGGSSGSGGGSTSSSEHLVMGNPSGAVHDVAYPGNYYMEKHQYVLSYNRDNGEPNWTAWHLSSSWLGSVTRQNDFRSDTSLPSGWYHVQSTSYSGSGYDRGHMCPSADRTLTVEDNSATFLMTNMVPQSANNNRGPWAKFETYLRTLVSSGDEIYIYSGGYGSQGTIDNGHVNVPAYTWKVALVLPDGDNDLSRVTASTRVITIEIPNNDTQVSQSDDWKQYRVSVDYVESQTGYDFLSNVSTSIQSQIESVVDNQ